MSLIVFAVTSWIGHFRCGLTRIWQTALSLFSFPGFYLCSQVTINFDELAMDQAPAGHCINYDELAMDQAPAEVGLFLSGYSELPTSPFSVLCGCL